MSFMKRVLPVLLVVFMVMSMPIAVFAQNSEMTVYVDQANGADSNDGLSESTAVQTLDQAYALLDAGLSATGTGTIVLVGDYEFAFAQAKDSIAHTVASHTYTVVFTGNEPTDSLIFGHSAQAYLQLLGPTKFENVGVRVAATGTVYVSIHGAGVNGSLIVGEGVTTSDNADLRPSLVAAPYAGANVAENQDKTMYMEVNSGDWKNLYAAGYTNETYGKCTLIMNGGSANKVSVSYSSKHTGEFTVDINGGTINELAMPCANSKGSVYGDLTVSISRATVKKNTALGTQGSGSYAIDLTTDGSALPVGEITVRNVTGGGTVTMDPSSLLNITGTVTGNTNIAFDGELRTGVVYVTAPEATADDAFTFDGCDAVVTAENGVKSWKTAGEKVFKGLVIQVKHFTSNPYSVILYSGISGTTEVAPSEVVTEDGVTSYYFEGLAHGTYHTKVSKAGYYTIKKVHYFTAEQMATKTALDLSTNKRVLVDGNPAKWQPAALQEFTVGMMENVLAPNDDSLWYKNYSAYLTSPIFTIENKGHQATTQDEMMDYIRSLDTDDDNMYVYSIGKSAKYDYDIPVVIFTKTNLSGAATLEQAAELINANNKLTVHYHAQIHGNEPAGGEAALAQIGRLDTGYGNGLLDNMNIYVIPRLNPDGSYEYIRNTPSPDGVSTNINGNRDMILVRTVEVQAQHYIYNLFMPEVAIDGHEYTVSNENNNVAYKDIMVAGGYTGNSGADFIAFTDSMTELIKPAMQSQGLDFSYYVNEVNNNYSVTGTAYMGLRGSVSFLLESRGIGFGNHTMDRRVISHLISLETIFDYVNENVDLVQAVSDAERQRIADSGKIYDESNPVVLEHKLESAENLSHTNTKYNYLTGTAVDTISVTPKRYVADKTRTRPTAYIIPAGEQWVEGVLEVLDHHSISYYTVEPGTTINLQQYTGSVTGAALTPETAVTFDKGAYVIPMNQSEALIVSVLMEPDLVDEYGVDDGTGKVEEVGTLAQMHYIPCENEVFPIYRYIHDLNEEGKVDVTTVAPSAAAYTVYVHSESGDDANDAYSESQPAKTIEHAFAQLTLQMADAPEGTSGTVVLLDMYHLGDSAMNYVLPEHEYPVIITSKTGVEGFSIGGATAKYEAISCGGDTTFQNITIKPLDKSSYYYLLANGHTMVIKDSVNTPTYVDANGKAAGNYFNLSAGTYSGTVEADAKLIVEGGTWQHLFSAGYAGSINGTATIELHNTTLTGNIVNAYHVNTNCDVDILVENTSVGGVFCAGNANKNDLTGNVTVTLGQGAQVANFYTGSRDSGNVKGIVTLIVDGADLTDTLITGGAKTTGTVTGSILVYNSGKLGTLAGSWKLGSDIPAAKAADGLKLNLAGHDVTDLAITGMAYVMDSATNSYNDANAGKLTCTGEVAAYWVADNGYRYVAVQAEDGSYTFHRVYVGITKLSLDTSVTGFGYKADFRASETVMKLVESQGYTLWLTEDTKVERSAEGFQKELTLRLENFDIENCGSAKVNAAVTMTLSNGVVVESEVVSYSMQDMVEMISAKLHVYNAEQILAVQNMLKDCSVVADWNISQLLAWNNATEE